MADLTLGTTPGTLELNYVIGDPAAYRIRLQSSAAEDATPVAWPEAPVLEFFGTNIAHVATLSSSNGGGVNDTATWELTEEQVAAIHALPERNVRVSVGGITWWKGPAINRG